MDAPPRVDHIIKHTAELPRFAATPGSAEAMAMAAEISALKPGKQVDVLILDTDRDENLANYLAVNPVSSVINSGCAVVTEGQIAA
jgi:cytosine/adenosine deaminase-related metal-dependent hydrolase